MEPKKPKKELNSYVKYSGIAMQMAAVIGLGMYGGVQLDQLITWKFPIFTLLLSLASVALGIYIAIKDFIKK